MDRSVAASRDETLGLATHEHSALLTSDLSHLGLDGLDLPPVWRQLPPQMPVVIISARLDCKREEDRALQLGAATCLAKPIILEQLHAAIQTGLSALPQTSVF